jgi:hypothetical protein
MAEIVGPQQHGILLVVFDALPGRDSHDPAACLAA